jgi:hypothetical protein
MSLHRSPSVARPGCVRALPVHEARDRDSEPGCSRTVHHERITDLEPKREQPIRQVALQLDHPFVPEAQPLAAVVAQQTPVGEQRPDLGVIAPQGCRHRVEREPMPP